MCNPASFIVTKGFKVFWSKTKDGHTDIRAEYNIPENDETRIKSVQVEITPPNGQFDVPLNEWRFAVDQDLLPDWWDVLQAEKHCRAALKDWAKCRLVRVGEKRDVNNGDYITAVCGGTVNEVRGGTVNAVRGGTVSFRVKFSVKICGLFSVIIDRTGEKARCIVGTEKKRIVKSNKRKAV